MRFRSLSISALLLVLMLAAPPAWPETLLFQEDFEAYDEGSNLFGQDGWVHEPVGSGSMTVTDVTLVGTGSGLGSKCSDGCLDPGHSNVSMCANLCIPAINQSKIYTLTYDAYAHGRIEEPGPSHNSGVKFHANNNRNAGGWEMSNNPAQGWPSSDFEGWIFDARYLTGTDTGVLQNLTPVEGGYDKKVTLITVVDPINLEMYGIADFGDEVHETQHFPILLEQFLKLDGIVLAQDYRSPGYGGEIDNITLIVNAPKPLAHYPFNGNLEDVSGNGFDLSAPATFNYSWAKGQCCMAIDVPHQQSYGWDKEAPHVEGLYYPGSGGWTVMAWVFVDNDENKQVIEQFTPYITGHEPYRIRIETGGDFFFHIEDKNGNKASVAYPVDEYIGHWVHIAGVYEYQSSVKLYLNGQLKDETPTSLVPETLTNYSTYIGGIAWGNEQSPSKLDDVRVYTHALTGFQVLDAMMEPGRKCPGDFDGDYMIDGQDLGKFADLFGSPF